MILKTLLLAAVAVATPLLSPNLASYNPSDSDSEIYKSAPSTPRKEIYRSTHPGSSKDATTTVGSYLDASSLSSAAAAAPAACTTGPAASANDESGFDIKDYTLVVPSSSSSSSSRSNTTAAYEVEKTWYKEHFVSGPHWFGYSPSEGQFGAWKCQFTCNAEEQCNGYFVWFEVDGKGEGRTMKCNLFDAVIPRSALVPTNATGIIAGGAYDRICKEHVKST
ncbi:hypothetical protein QBC41DRAFT_213915 [Cercophora samala]|uniref:Uncharacterized protein n=1 Tax=Cercophora samala TaxID=330535 RepID=A0AA39ZN28_9PEZI|nr:hypothetical protein QBC41DRAFT_213915 [Cercophora samala]